MLIFSLWFCVGGLCQEVEFPVSLCAHACMCVCVYVGQQTGVSVCDGCIPSCATLCV